jgi:hypothetical protein
METGLSAALVADSAAQIAPVIDRPGARLEPWVAGLRTRVLDGNLLGKTQSRLRELRATRAAALPGRVVAVDEPDSDPVARMVLAPDGHAGERSLLDEVLAGVAADDLWVADRNFCTREFLFGLAARGRGSRSGTPRRSSADSWASGWRGAGRGPAESSGSVWTSPARVAEIDRKRWAIEDRFFELATTLDGEPNALGYPVAAAFAFGLAVVASNAVGLRRASLRAVHGAEDVASMSRHDAASEVRRTYAGMVVALPPEVWESLRGSDAEALAGLLRELAGRVKPEDYCKVTRGPKKPPTLKARYKNGGHVATHRLIEQRRKP